VETSEGKDDISEGEVETYESEVETSAGKNRNMLLVSYTRSTG
jgi:hypothetical protein